MNYIKAIFLLVLMQVGCATSGNSDDLSPYIKPKTLSVENEKKLYLKSVNRKIEILTSFKLCLEKSQVWSDIKKCDNEENKALVKIAEEVHADRQQLLDKMP